MIPKITTEDLAKLLCKLLFLYDNTPKRKRLIDLLEEKENLNLPSEYVSAAFQYLLGQGWIYLGDRRYHLTFDGHWIGYLINKGYLNVL